jgi:succinoglycan biosynthesis protein ExoA
MRVSIIIPTLNESATIEGVIASVLAFRKDSMECDIIVVDGDSDDGTREKLDELTLSTPNLIVLHNPRRKTPMALNIGLAHAKGEVVLRLDAHSQYPEDYLEKCVRSLESESADNVGGLVVPRWTNRGKGAQIVAALTSHIFGVGDSGFRTSVAAGAADTVPYGCFRRSVFEEIGKFDERLNRNQDYEFNRRMIAAGKRIWLDPSIRVFYENRDTVSGVLKQAFTTAQWNPWMWLVAPYSFAFRHAIPGIVVAAGAALVVLSFLSATALAILTMLSALYACTAIVASVQQACRYGWWIGFVLPPLFLAYHISYGAGMWLGILKVLLGVAPVQKLGEPWLGAGRYRAWPCPR